MKTHRKALALSSLTVLAMVTSAHFLAQASDHDDGSQATNQNNLNLTDLFAFREDNQTGNSGDSGNLVLIMNSNGHTPPGQQVFFNTGGRYDFHITRVSSGNLDTPPTGADDLILRFEFGEPDSSQHQPISVTAIRDGQSLPGTVTPARTTTLAEGKAGTATENQVSLGDARLTVFAGLREDPFFFDVAQFFKVRAGAAGLGPEAAFLPPAQAVDGFAKQNVNSIVVRVPLTFLQGNTNSPVFDIWETTSLR